MYIFFVDCPPTTMVVRMYYVYRVFKYICMYSCMNKVQKNIFSFTQKILDFRYQIVIKLPHILKVSSRNYKI